MGAHASHLPAALGHLAERLENYGIVEFAEVRVPAPRERHRTCIRLVARHSFGAPDGGGFLTKPLDQYFDQRQHLARRKITGRTQDKKTRFRWRMIDQHRHERA
jgi:hypothetical protein